MSSKSYNYKFNSCNKKRNITKIYLFDIDKNEKIFSKYDVYFLKDNQGNRQYYSTKDDSPLFQSIELVDDYKKLNIQMFN